MTEHSTNTSNHFHNQDTVIYSNSVKLQITD